MTKLCSVIIPTRNRPQSLRRAVCSALDALPPNSEIIVVDDGSAKKASDVLREFLGDRLTVIVNGPPHGPSQARNMGLLMAQGKTIFFLDDDDEILPDYIRKIIRLRESLPDNCVYGFSSALLKTKQGTKPFSRKHLTGGLYDAKVPLSNRLAGLGMGFWVDRKIIQSLGGLDERLRVNEDTELCIRLASHGYTCFKSKAPGVILEGDGERHQNDQVSITTCSTALSRALGFEYILMKHCLFLHDHPKVRRKYMFRILRYRWRSRSVQGWKEFIGKYQLGWSEAIFKYVVTAILINRSR